MTEKAPDPTLDAEAHHHALLTLHEASGVFKGVNPALLKGIRPFTAAEALQTVADAPIEEIPVSARLGLLHNLARAGFPDFETAEGEYRSLADSVASRRGLHADRLLDDLKRSAGDNVPFSETPAGQALPHEDTAFIGQDICNTRRVEVGGLAGTWIFSEFETDAPFEQVAEWIDPRNWPERGPMLFKGMSIVGSAGPVAISSPAEGHWHAVFHEEVQLVRRLNTLLHCDFWRDGDRAAGMTYDLDVSLDHEIDVDRGFLLVVDTGPVRRVKALKIVGFTQNIWDDVSLLVCPFWTDFVRGAARGGSASKPTPPSTPADGTGTPADGTGTPPAGDEDSTPWAETFDLWVKFFGDSARSYLELFEDVSSRATTEGYSRSDLVDDGMRAWSQLAKDWAKAWTYGLEKLDDLASDGLAAGFVPPDSPSQTQTQGQTPRQQSGRTAGGGTPSGSTPSGSTRRWFTGDTATPGYGTAGTAQPGAEATTVPIAGLAATDRPVCSDLVSIEAGGATIPAGDITVTVVPMPDGSSGARVSTANRTVAAGLYVGQINSPAGMRLAPVHLYLSRAAGA